MERGLFLTFEGIEGVGKSTNMKYFASQLEKRGIPVLQTREPGGTAIGEEIRDLLLSNRHRVMEAETELLLMFAARAQHIQECILPALTSGTWVLCDRFTDATFAYQGKGRDIDLTKITMLEKYFQNDLMPDYVFIFDAPVELGLQRAQKRGAMDRIEQETYEFFEKVRLAYLERANANLNRYHVIDASQPLNIVRDKLIVYLEQLLQPVDS